jgi:hypothetical protein
MHGVLDGGIGLERRGTPGHQAFDGDLFQVVDQPGDPVKHIAFGKYPNELPALSRYQDATYIPALEQGYDFGQRSIRRHANRRPGLEHCELFG